MNPSETHPYEAAPEIGYELTPADRAPLPESYSGEQRYLKYRATDLEMPYAPFFEHATRPVAHHVREALLQGMAPPEFGRGVRDFASALSGPGYDAMETGWTRMGRQTYISVLTDMPGVTAQMWDWWFGWHSRETARYKLWYPDAHQFTAVGDDRSHDRDLTDRQRYVDNVSYADEYIGGIPHRLAIRFVDQSRFGFDDEAGRTQICARVGFSNVPVAFGWLVHQVRPTEGGSEMRSRFFLNDPSVMPTAVSPDATQLARRAASVVSRIGIRPLPARLVSAAMPASIGPDMLYHCGAEMNHLAGFLPKLYDAFKDVP